MARFHPLVPMGKISGAHLTGVSIAFAAPRLPWTGFPATIVGATCRRETLGRPWILHADSSTSRHLRVQLPRQAGYSAGPHSGWSSSLKPRACPRDPWCTGLGRQNFRRQIGAFGSAPTIALAGPWGSRSRAPSIDRPRPPFLPRPWPATTIHRYFGSTNRGGPDRRRRCSLRPAHRLSIRAAWAGQVRPRVSAPGFLFTMPTSPGKS